jgi:hypothetical protein
MKKTIIILTLLNLYLFSDTLQRDDSAQTVYDSKTSLIWQDSKDAQELRLTHQEAIDYCTNLTIGDVTTWRLPSLVELTSIVTPNKYNPSIDNIFQNTSRSGFYWTSDIVKGRSAAYYVRFDFGRDGSINMTSKNNVRCVYSR